MKLLLIGLDGVRFDVAFANLDVEGTAFEYPNHPADPRFAQSEEPKIAGPMPPHGLPSGPTAPTLQRLLATGMIAPIWMTPPTDSGPGWSSLLTGTTHEENNVWWNEFVGHNLAECPDVLSRVFFANPKARTFAASTWDALVSGSGPGPVIHQRVDQQKRGQHKLFAASDFSRGCKSADIEVRTHACQILNHEGPDAAFVYFEGVDEAGHEHGAASTEYFAAVSAVDEHVRYLIKAVAERYEALGEDWLVAITTDHGHKDEGGHGEDEVVVRRSFVLLHRIGGTLDIPEKWKADDESIRPLYSHDVTPLLLDVLGVHNGSWSPSHEVGVLKDIPSVGPTRNLTYEW